MESSQTSFDSGIQIPELEQTSSAEGDEDEPVTQCLLTVVNKLKVDDVVKQADEEQNESTPSPSIPSGAPAPTPSSSGTEMVTFKRELKVDDDDDPDEFCRNIRYKSIKFCDKTLTEVAKIFEGQMDQLQISFGKTFSKYKAKLEAACSQLQKTKNEIVKLKDEDRLKKKDNEGKISKLKASNEEALKTLNLKKKEVFAKVSHAFTLSTKKTKLSHENRALREELRILEETSATTEREAEELRKENELILAEIKNNDLQDRNKELLKLTKEVWKEQEQIYQSCKRKYEEAFGVQEELEITRTPNNEVTLSSLEEVTPGDQSPPPCEKVVQVEDEREELSMSNNDLESKNEMLLEFLNDTRNRREQVCLSYNRRYEQTFKETELGTPNDAMTLSSLEEVTPDNGDVGLPLDLDDGAGEAGARRWM